MNDSPIFMIHLHWQRLPDSPLLAVRADGLADSQVRHYGRRAGLRRITIDENAPRWSARSSSGTRFSASSNPLATT